MDIKSRIIDIIGLVIFLVVCLYALIMIAVIGVIDKINRKKVEK